MPSRREFDHIGSYAFKQTLRYGVDLQKLNIGENLTQKGVNKADIEKLDTNKDGVIKGRELNSLFRYVDSFDQNGSGNSFATDQTGGVLYGALKEAKREGPYYGKAIAKAATDRAAADPEGYAFPNAPTSPRRDLSQNTVPGKTRPRWLKNQWKCNQFVGDALTQAGVEMPTYTMSNGTKHYVHAEKLPSFKNHFDRITDLKEMKPGDVFVFDRPETGLATAHTEVISKVHGPGKFSSIGAHKDGAYEENNSDMLDGASYNAQKRAWDLPSGATFYILRPNKRD